MGQRLTCLLVLATACEGTRTIELPQVERLSPDAELTDVDVPVIIEGRGFSLGLDVGFDDGAVRIDEEFAVVLINGAGEEVALTEVAWTSHTELAAIVPAGLPPGSYAARVTGPAGVGPPRPDAFEALGACVDRDTDGVCDSGDACVDADADGSGDGTLGNTACAMPLTDCDDDPAACGAGCFPGNPAPDIADGRDQDCDAQIDEDVDTTPPVITLLGDNPETVGYDTVYADPGATAIDDVDGDISSAVVVTGTVDTRVLGATTVDYDVSDAAGNDAITVTRTVNVSDILAPVMMLVGTDPVFVDQFAAYVDAGATATDDVDGDLTAQILVTNPVDTAVAGSYTVTYDVQDAAGNPAQLTRTVVVRDGVPPTLTRLGTDPLYVYQDASFVDPMGLALDNVDGDISGDIVVTGTVDTATLGSTTLTYNVQDSSGNPATPFTRQVHVIHDCTDPTVAARPLEQNLQALSVGSVYVVCALSQLEEIGTDAMDTSFAAAYLLGADIDAAVTAMGSYNGGSGWQPLGHCGTGTCSDADEVYFTGVFYGGFRTIDGLVINRGTERGIGLFGAASAAQIVNLALTQVSIVGFERVGSLAGFVTSSTVISRCSATGVVTGNDQRVGGLVGYEVGTSSIERSFADVTVSGGRAGGLVGFKGNASVADSYATGDVSGNDINGGLIGLDTNGQTRRSYATGNVSGVRAVGGLIGQTSGPGSIVEACFHTGSVTGNTSNDDYVGPVVGRNHGIAQSDVYYDGTAPVVNMGTGTLTIGVGTLVDVGGAAPADYFFTPSSLPLSLWDFTDVWQPATGAPPTLR